MVAAGTTGTMVHHHLYCGAVLRGSKEPPIGHGSQQASGAPGAGAPGGARGPVDARGGLQHGDVPCSARNDDLAAADSHLRQPEQQGWGDDGVFMLMKGFSCGALEGTGGQVTWSSSEGSWMGLPESSLAAPEATRTERSPAPAGLRVAENLVPTVSGDQAALRVASTPRISMCSGRNPLRRQADQDHVRLRSSPDGPLRRGEGDEEDRMPKARHHERQGVWDEECRRRSGSGSRGRTRESLGRMGKVEESTREGGLEGCRGEER